MDVGDGRGRGRGGGSEGRQIRGLLARRTCTRGRRRRAGRGVAHLAVHPRPLSHVPLPELWVRAHDDEVLAPFRPVSHVERHGHGHPAARDVSSLLCVSYDPRDRRERSDAAAPRARASPRGPRSNARANSARSDGRDPSAKPTQRGAPRGMRGPAAFAKARAIHHSAFRAARCVSRVTGAGRAVTRKSARRLAIKRVLARSNPPRRRRSRSRRHTPRAPRVAPLARDRPRASRRLHRRPRVAHAPASAPRVPPSPRAVVPGRVDTQRPRRPSPRRSHLAPPPCARREV